MPKSSAAVSARLRVGVAFCVLAAAVAGVIVLLCLPTDSPAAHEHSVKPTQDVTDPALIEVNVAPLKVPDSLSLSSETIAPDDPIIGVSVGEKHRAYALTALAGVSQHVVNDILDGRAVSVTYCVKTGCARVFTGPNGRRLRLAVGGWYDKEGEKQMVIRDEGERYQQETGNSMSGGTGIPYGRLNFKLTTWGEWHKAHPTSDVFTGGAVADY